MPRAMIAMSIRAAPHMWHRAWFTRASSQSAIVDVDYFFFFFTPALFRALRSA